MKVIVLIADIISSRYIKDRNTVQKKLRDILKKINHESRSILSPMTITLGDEFQCVYSNADDIFGHIWEIINACHPEQIRFSLGIGEITTSINRKRAIGMDGPAFYAAREGLNALKRTDYFFNINGDGKDSETLDFIRNILYLVSYNIAMWRKNRIEIMNLMTKKITVKIIAERMKISEQAVYKNINSGGLQPILDVTKNITLMINKIVES